ncbi:MAG: FAD-dependent oxidoreductase [Acidimicrobiia bacterium]
MTPATDVVVVGGGIVGAAIGYQLARRSVQVVVLDKGAGPAEGSTGASSSISRCRYTDPRVVRLALDGQRAYRNWSEFTGLPDPASTYIRTGVVWMFDESRSEVQAEAERLGRAGVAVSVVDAEGLRDRHPSLSACVAPFDLSGEVAHECRDAEAALVEDDGGYADPAGACADLLDGTRRAGGVVRFRARVTGLIRTNGGVTGVEVDGERIPAGLVVNASGPWCNALNAMAGVGHRWTLDPTRIQVVYRDLPGDLGPIPVLADGSTGIYLRPDAGGTRILFGSVLPEDEEEVVADPDDFPRHADAAFRDRKIHALHHRIPALEHRGGLSGIAGLYTINRQDVHPIVGPSGVDGFWLANGFSGHGFKLAPMIGSMVARAVSGVDADFDTEVPMSVLAVDRQPISVATRNVLA